MALAYFDCFAGAGGDMIAAALIDAGCDWEALKGQIANLGLDNCSTSIQSVHRGGIGATQFIVEADAKAQPRRGLSDIIALIEAADLAPRVVARAKAVFTRLGQAEAKVHKTDIENIHFHEVGAADTIVDVVAACAAVEVMGIESVYCSAIPLGSGSVQCDHGELPVPAPATAELLTGAKTTAGCGCGELTTPTAAAVLTTLAEDFGPPPAMKLTAVGYGAGTKDQGPLPNLLRVLIGEGDEAGQLDAVVELAANLDDCTGEVIGATIEKLLAAGCLDAWAAPIVMKKSRPGWTLSALCSACDVEAAERIILTETTTFGVRRQRSRRTKLIRRFESVETPYGPIRIKIGSVGRREVSVSPEFADCLAAAEAHGAPVKEVIAAATAVYRRKQDQ